MRYAKLIENEIQYAPNPILIDDRQIGNPPAELYLEQGYKPVTYTDPPETDPGYVAVPGWEDDGEAIIQTWTIEEEPDDVDSERAMQILFGGDEE